MFSRDLFRLLDPQKPCAMPTYSRSTMLRVTLLLAGFYVGRGHATGEKEETTIAANSLHASANHWIVLGCCAANVLAAPNRCGMLVYRQSPLSDATWEELRAHPTIPVAEARSASLIRP